MKRFAAMMNDRNNERKFVALEQKLSSALLTRFWRKPVPGPINRQTPFATLLYYNLSCSYNSPYGTITSSWIKKSPGNYQFNLKIPAGTEASVRLPFKKFNKITIIKVSDPAQSVTKPATADFNLSKGQYEIEVRL